jgi:hypothetical protein
MAIAKAYTSKFSYRSHSSYSRAEEKVYRESFYDYLYEHDYEPWFCNMVEKIFGVRALKEWLLRIHTGESFAGATQNWPWDKRQTLGQIYLKNLARDFIVWYQEQSDGYAVDSYKKVYEEMIRRLEIDGYVFRDGELLQTEVEVLDVEAERGLLESLHLSLGIARKEGTRGRRQNLWTSESYRRASLHGRKGPSTPLAADMPDSHAVHNAST